MYSFHNLRQLLLLSFTSYVSRNGGLAESLIQCCRVSGPHMARIPWPKVLCSTVLMEITSPDAIDGIAQRLGSAGFSFGPDVLRCPALQYYTSRHQMT